MEILILIFLAGIFFILLYVAYKMRKDEFLEIKEYATFITETINGRFKWPIFHSNDRPVATGNYKGYIVEVYLERHRTQIYILSDKLPKQKHKTFVLSDPEIAPGISQFDNSLCMTTVDKEIGNSFAKKASFIDNIEMLLAKVKQLEAVNSLNTRTT